MPLFPEYLTAGDALRLLGGKRVLQNLMPDWVAFMWGLYVDVDLLTPKPTDPRIASYRDIAIAQFRQVYTDWSFDQLFLFLACSAFTCFLLYKHPKRHAKPAQLLLFSAIYGVAAALDGAVYLCTIRFAWRNQLQEQTHMMVFVASLLTYAFVMWRNNTFSDLAVREVMSEIRRLQETSVDTKDRLELMEQALEAGRLQREELMRLQNELVRVAAETKRDAVVPGVRKTKKNS